MPDQKTFLYDDFFIPSDDPGIEKLVHIKGRDIPIRFKRGFSMDDIQAAKAVAVKSKVNLKTGQMEIVGVDEGKFMNELLYRAIVAWPFTDRNGRKVAIDRETIGELCAEGSQVFMAVLNELIGVGQQNLDFFESPSGEASSVTAPAL